MVIGTSIKSLFWDFDGVILDSMVIRDRGFSETLRHFPSDQVEQLLKYHQLNGGLSRYHKFRYFFEVIRQESITEQGVRDLADQFSDYVVQFLSNKELLISDSIQFIEKYHRHIDMHVVSGSDQTELRMLCEKLGIHHYFKTINGSPTPKTKLVQGLLTGNGYNSEEVCLIGDSTNDLEAARDHQLSFWGYNNSTLKSQSEIYIDSFSTVTFQDITL